ncbi:MAG TPA: ABC transporter permease [Vicinamibacterales bacterium]|jgi:lipopolysaccharide transport system permease protein|nr:ABC transporter permease [Vicinamibacterales bacterium]
MNAIPLHAQTRRLAPSSGWDGKELAEVWASRELLYFLIWRDIKVRYKQTALGAAWAIVQPVLTMIVFTVFFGRLAQLPSDGIPYPVFAMAALVPWTYFATALSSGSQSVVANQHVLTKVYFPRLLMPLAAVLGPLVDFAIAFAVLVAMMLWYGIAPGVAVVWLPLLLLLAILTAAAASIWLAALNVQYRDVRYVVPFFVQLWMFATPVAYASSLVPDRWRIVYGLNPMAGVIEGFRWALVRGSAPGLMTLTSAIVVMVALAAGIVYFRRLEGTFADRV